MINRESGWLVQRVGQIVSGFEGLSVLCLGEYQVSDIVTKELGTSHTMLRDWIASLGAARIDVASWGSDGLVTLLDACEPGVKPEWSDMFDVVFVMNPQPDISGADTAELFANVARFLRPSGILATCLPSRGYSYLMASPDLLPYLARVGGFETLHLDCVPLAVNTRFRIRRGVFRKVSEQTVASSTHVESLLVSPEPRTYNRAKTFDSINLWITTDCNRRCKWCFAGIPARKKREPYPASYFDALAQYLTGIKHIVITGGDPLTHPEFNHIVPHIRNLLNPEQVIVESNGFKLRDCLPGLSYVDSVSLSWYTARSYPGAVDNTQQVTDALGDCRNAGIKAVTGHVVHRPPVADDDTRPRRWCERVPAGRAEIVDSRAYPCCSATPGTTESVPVDANWRAALAAVPISCERCRFGEV